MDNVPDLRALPGSWTRRLNSQVHMQNYNLSADQVNEGLRLVSCFAHFFPLFYQNLFEPALMNKLVPCIWLSSVALEMFRL